MTDTPDAERTRDRMKNAKQVISNLTPAAIIRIFATAARQLKRLRDKAKR